MTIDFGTIIVAIIAAIGGSLGSIFGYRQFLIKRKDEKEEKNTQKLIDKAIQQAREEMEAEFYQGLQEREETGRMRFEINSKAIEENTSQINKLVELVENQIIKMNQFAESGTLLNTTVKVIAESQRNANYDRLLFVANKVLTSQKISITEKTNLRQLYTSWKELNGEDAKIETMYEECLKLPLDLEE